VLATVTPNATHLPVVAAVSGYYNRHRLANPPPLHLPDLPVITIRAYCTGDVVDFPVERSRYAVLNCSLGAILTTVLRSTISERCITIYHWRVTAFPFRAFILLRWLCLPLQAVAIVLLTLVVEFCVVLVLDRWRATPTDVLFIARSYRYHHHHLVCIAIVWVRWCLLPFYSGRWTVYYLPADITHCCYHYLLFRLVLCCCVVWLHYHFVPFVPGGVFLPYRHWQTGDLITSPTTCRFACRTV